MKRRKCLLSLGLPFCLFINSAALKFSSNSVSSRQNASAAEIVLPTPTGSYRVGRASFHGIDESRLEPFTEDPSDHREVLFQIWYPAESTGGTVAPYVDSLPDDEVFRYAFVGIERLMKTRSHALSGVKVSTRMMLFRTARQTICSSKDGCRRTVRSSVRSPRRRVELRS